MASSGGEAVRTKIKNLLDLGVSLTTQSSMASAARGEPDESLSSGRTLACERHMERTPTVQQALSDAWLKAQGLVSVKDLWSNAQGYTN